MENKITNLNEASSQVLAQEATKILIENKALDIKMFYVKEHTSITDYYINVTGRSNTQVAALADELSDLLSERGRNALRIEGRSGNAWILVDYGDLIVNVFDKQSRDFYSLDRHLPDGTEVDISDLIAEIDKKYEI